MVASKYAVLAPVAVLAADAAVLAAVLGPEVVLVADAGARAADAVAALVAARVNYRRTPRGHITPTTKG